jgi:hypothetical protein
MDSIDSYIGYGGMVCVAVFWVIWIIHMFRYRKQLKEAFLQSGMIWPFPSQMELRRATREDLVQGLAKTYMIPIKMAQILFFMRTDNPIILKPLRRIRRLFLYLIGFGSLFMLILLIIAAIFAPQ